MACRCSVLLLRGVVIRVASLRRIIHLKGFFALRHQFVHYRTQNMYNECTAPLSASSMAHDLLDRLLMHLRQPCMRVERPDPLAEEHEHQHKQVVCQQNTTEDPRNDGGISRLFHPIQQVQAKGERDQLLADAHGNERLRHVGLVGIDRVREREGEVEVCSASVQGSLNL